MVEAAQVVTTSVDVGAWVQGAAGLLGLAVLWFIRRLITSVDGFKAFVRADLTQVKTDVSKATSEIQSVKQELFGLSGQNGIRGEQREMRRTIETLQVDVRALTDRPAHAPMRNADR